MSGTSGPMSPPPFVFYDPASSCWRTSNVIFALDSPTSSPTLPPSGSMRSGALRARRRSAPLTSGAGSSSSRGLLPTPRTSDTNGAGKHGDGGLDLRTTVSLLPTPTATRPATTANFRPDGTPYSSGYGMTLLDAARLLPTPRATDGTKGGPNQRGSSGDLMLPSAVTQMSTGAPTAPRSTGGPQPSGGPHQLQLSLDETGDPA